MKSFTEFFLEYRHDLADGTPAPSIQAHNGKNPNRVGPDKKYLYTKGDRPLDNPKLKVPNSTLTALELGELGITDFTDGNVYDNFKNSGFGFRIKFVDGQPIGVVFKSRPKITKVKPHLSIAK